MNVPLPTVTLTGTPKARLIDDLNMARHAVDEAIEALRATAPNARDYPSKATFDAARELYGHENETLVILSSRLYARAIAIDEQA